MGTRACRWVMWLAERVVPGALRPAWREDWRGDFWEWTLRAASANSPDSKEALTDHTKRAFKAAWDAQFYSELGIQAWLTRMGDPRFCLALGVLPLIAVAIFSEGFSDSRRLVRGLPYANADRVVGIVQGSPLLGMRLGFAEKEIALFRQEAKTLEGVATYQWYDAKVEIGRQKLDVSAAHIGPGFLRVFGTKPALGSDLEDVAGASHAFMASYDFWKSELHGDPGQIGKHFWIGGKPMRLAGVMPKGFWFLVGDTAIWTLHEPAPPPPMGRWWLRTRSTVARVRPGVAVEAVDKELRELQVKNQIARPNWGVYATSTSTVVYQSIWLYGEAMLAVMGGLLIWAIVKIRMDRGRDGLSMAIIKYWGFLALKVAAPLLAIFFCMAEFTGANTLSMAGRGVWARILLSDWAFFCSVVLLVVWTLRDQRARCHVCLHRMRQPVRIGIPGQILLDATGVEVMCPAGHGALYTSESILGSEMSNRWMAFEDVLR